MEEAINEINNEITRLQQKLMALTEQIVNLDQKDEKNENIICSLYEQKALIRKQLFDLKDKLIFIVPPINTNGIIELRANPKSLADGYFICLCGTNKIIGDIQYRGYHCSKYIGDIGYGIDAEYRGKGYAYQALCLLSETLYEQGISDFWITVHQENIPSVKTIAKYGGEIVDNTGEAPSYIVLFECPTRLINEKKTVNEEKKIKI